MPRRGPFLLVFRELVLHEVLRLSSFRGRPLRSGRGIPWRFGRLSLEPFRPSDLPRLENLRAPFKVVK